MLTEAMWEERRGHACEAIRHVEGKVGQDHDYQFDSQCDKTMVKMLLAQMDVAEFYSPERVTAMAKAMGLKVGWSLALTTQDKDEQA